MVLAEGLVLAVIGIGQYADHHIFWNGKLDASNDFHFYFRVNSLFWDPNIYGRYLVLAVLLGTTGLVWAASRRLALGLAAVVAVVFAGLVFAFSQTSFIALFIGLAVLAALRWSVRWAAIATPLALAAIAVGVLFVAGGSHESTRTVTEGHSSLVSGGVKLARHRPLYGYGSASFSKAFASAEQVPPGDTTISHTEPVTVAAEQGVIGIARLSGAARGSPVDGLRRDAFDGTGFRRRPSGPSRRGTGSSSPRPGSGSPRPSAALLVHTIGYAAYLTDPLTWALLAVGGVLAAEVGAGGWPRRRGDVESSEPAESAAPPTVAS